MGQHLDIDSDDLIVTESDGVATVRLHRPARKNAITIEMATALSALFDRFRRLADIRAVVLTGTGDAFCGGGDLGRIREQRTPAEHRRRLTEHMHEVVFSLERFDKPVIAAINGDAFGAGMDLALMCDMRFAAASARLSEGYILAGLVPGDGACWFLPRLIGIGQAFELLLTGNTIDAEQSARIGLVNRVFEPDQLLEATQQVAAQIAEKPSAIVQLTKRCLYESARPVLRTSLDLVASHMGIARSLPESGEQFSRFSAERDRARRLKSSNKPSRKEAPQ